MNRFRFRQFLRLEDDTSGFRRLNLNLYLEAPAIGQMLPTEVRKI